MSLLASSGIHPRADRENVRLIVGILLVAVISGLALGGRLSGLSELRIRWGPLAVVGLCLQYFAPSSGAWPYALLMVSFITLTVFAAVNLRVAGFALILAGMSMNFLVIGLNHGMPVTQRALVGSGQQSTLADLVADGGAKHHLSGPHDRLLFLADVIPIAPPIAQIVSAGDIVSYAGVGYVVVAAMRRGRRRKVAEPENLERIPVGAGAGAGAEDTADG
jgi:Family of unknown function (DUF5317)